MDQVMVWVSYLRDHPSYGVWAVVAIVAVYVLLNRKSRVARDAERRVAELQRERGDHYNKMRPMR